jgi:hypothetical protein
MTDPVIEYRTAVTGRHDTWVPACGGLEPVSLINGRRIQYVFNPARGEHGWLDLDTDLVSMDPPY